MFRAMIEAAPDPASSDPAVAVSGIAKAFRTAAGRVVALDNLTLEIPVGGVFGLLGPNGAGKSTLLRIICGLVRADAGEVRILGEPPGPQARQRLGALIDAPLFYPFLTGREVLAVLARTSGATADTEALLHRVGLASAADRRVASYSLGMKQRLGIAAALVGDPAVVVLDEPTNGLDPDGVLEVRGLVRDLSKRDGRTVLLSSHLLDEVQRVCDHVAILVEGRLAAAGQVDELLRGERFWLDARPAGRALELLGRHAAAEADGIVVGVERGDVPRLIAELVEAGVAIHEARWLRRNLEDLFLAETRRER